jgi:hypothetical protein
LRDKAYSLVFGIKRVTKLDYPKIRATIRVRYVS